MATHREVAHGARSISPSPLTVTEGECLGCATELPVYTLRCNCLYCRQCLELLFRSTINRGRFPATCCVNVSIADYATILPQDLVQLYLLREEEFGSQNRTYCHNPKCSTFISERRIVRGIRNCPKCGENTCETCKRAEHSGPCVQDESDKEVLEYGSAQGWKKCNGCGHLVEKTEGCNYMTCRCGYHFCYVCGNEWALCSCPTGPGPRRRHWVRQGPRQNQARQTRARQILERQTQVRMVPAAPGAQRRSELEGSRQFEPRQYTRGEARTINPNHMAEQPERINNAQGAIEWAINHNVRIPDATILDGIHIFDALLALQRRLNGLRADRFGVANTPAMLQCLHPEWQQPWQSIHPGWQPVSPTYPPWQMLWRPMPNDNLCHRCRQDQQNAMMCSHCGLRLCVQCRSGDVHFIHSLLLEGRTSQMPD